MRPQVFVRGKNDVFGDLRLLFPEVWMRCLRSPRMASKPKLLALAGQEVPLIGALTGWTTLGQSGPGCNEGKG